MMSATNGTGNNTILSTFVERQPAIMSAALRAGRRRAADTSAHLSRRGAMAASAELVNTAVSRLIELAYQVDDTGLRCNVDEDGRLLMPVPWGRSYQRYALRATESAVLGLHVKRLWERPPVAPLFVYDVDMRAWFVNVFDYGDYAAAVAYWRRAQLGAGDYMALLREVQSKRGNGA